MTDRLPAWRAVLALDFACQSGRTVLARSHHEGPLRVQKLLYPQAGGPCHALLLHPPSGVASGDELHLDIRIRNGAGVLLTSPGAGKWYRSRSDGGLARQQVHLTVAPDASCEWLPQEAVVHPGARATQSLEIDLATGSRLLGWDLVQLGLPAPGACFDQGLWQQSLCLRRDGRPVWEEQGELMGSDPLLTAAQGLDGQPVFGTWWAHAPHLPAIFESLLESVRDELAAHASEGMRVAAGWLPAPAQLLLVRGVAGQVEPLRRLWQLLWARLRASVIGVAPSPPRIWST